MNIKTMKEAILLAKEGGVCPFMWGHRGLGKSSLVKQVCADNHMGFIDMRCSQMEASDIRGLPDRSEDGRTVFLPPADMPMGGMKWEQLMKKIGSVKGHDGKPIGEFSLELLDEVARGLRDKSLFNEAYEMIQLWRSNQRYLEEGILFLDEINRAQDDVIQAVFQLVLDREIGQYVLPPGWGICCAGNYMEGYIVNGFTDPAFLNRFSHLILSDGDLTMEEWVDYMGNVHGDKATAVIEFCTQNVKHLDGNIEGDMGFSVQPSRRSWEFVIKIEQAFNRAKYEFSGDAKHKIIAGLVGAEMANSYQRYNCPVRPRDLLNGGVKGCLKKLNQLKRGQLVGLTWGVANMVKPRIHEEKYGHLALDFAEWICSAREDKDLAVAFATNLVAGSGNAKARSAMISNPNVAQLIGKFRKVGKGKKQFIDYLNDHPVVQKLLSESAWGSGFGED